MKQENISKIAEDLIRKIFPNHELQEELINSQLEFVKLRSELSIESDRGCVLLAAAHLDFMLEKLLRKKLLGNKKELDKIFNFNGPCGTFSSKIVIAYSIGLLPKLALDDIENIRKIRNNFAHSTNFISFENSSIKNVCDGLNYNVKSNAKPKIKFINVVSSLSGIIEGQLVLVKKFDECVDVNLEKRKESFQKIMEILKNTS